MFKFCYDLHGMLLSIRNLPRSIKVICILQACNKEGRSPCHVYILDAGGLDSRANRLLMILWFPETDCPALPFSGNMVKSFILSPVVFCLTAFSQTLGNFSVRMKYHREERMWILPKSKWGFLILPSPKEGKNNCEDREVFSLLDQLF